MIVSFRNELITNSFYRASVRNYLYRDKCKNLDGSNKLKLVVIFNVVLFLVAFKHQIALPWEKLWMKLTILILKLKLKLMRDAITVVAHYSLLLFVLPFMFNVKPCIYVCFKKGCGMVVLLKQSSSSSFFSINKLFVSVGFFKPGCRSFHFQNWQAWTCKVPLRGNWHI